MGPPITTHPLNPRCVHCVLSPLEPPPPFSHHPRNEGHALEHLAIELWLLEQIGLHPREQVSALFLELLLLQTLSTMTLNFLKLILPVALGTNQQLPQSSGDGRWGRGGQFTLLPTASWVFD